MATTDTTMNVMMMAMTVMTLVTIDNNDVDDENNDARWITHQWLAACMMTTNMTVTTMIMTTLTVMIMMTMIDYDDHSHTYEEYSPMMGCLQVGQLVSFGRQLEQTGWPDKHQKQIQLSENYHHGGENQFEQIYDDFDDFGDNEYQSECDDVLSMAQ